MALSPKRAAFLPRRYYVYELLKPNGTVFYVGKGKGRRMYAHAANARAGDIGNVDKHNVITAIHEAGQEVGYRVVAEGLNEKRAYALEAETIRKHGISNLTNASAGFTDSQRAIARAAHLVKRIIPFPIWCAMAPRSEADRELYWLVSNGLEREAGRSI